MGQAGHIGQGLQMIGTASIRKALRFVHYNPAQSMLLIYFLVLSCSCVKTVLCDIEPQPAVHFDDDDDDARTLLVSLFIDSTTKAVNVVAGISYLFIIIFFFIDIIGIRT